MLMFLIQIQNLQLSSCVSRNKTRKTKARLELNLAKNVKDDKKTFLKYINNKRKTKENAGLLINGQTRLHKPRSLNLSP